MTVNSNKAMSHDGATALLTAASQEGGLAGMADLLVKAGANVNHTMNNSSDTAMSVAIIRRSPRKAALVLGKHGVPRGGAEVIQRLSNCWIWLRICRPITVKRLRRSLMRTSDCLWGSPSGVHWQQVPGQLRRETSRSHQDEGMSRRGKKCKSVNHRQQGRARMSRRT